MRFSFIHSRDEGLLPVSADVPDAAGLPKRLLRLGRNVAERAPERRGADGLNRGVASGQPGRTMAVVASTAFSAARGTRSDGSAWQACEAAGPAATESTTDSAHSMPITPNLVERDFKPCGARTGGGGHHVYPLVGGRAVPRGGGRPLVPRGGGLVDGRPHAHRAPAPEPQLPKRPLRCRCPGAQGRQTG